MPDLGTGRCNAKGLDLVIAIQLLVCGHGQLVEFRLDATLWSDTGLQEQLLSEQEKSLSPFESPEI